MRGLLQNRAGNGSGKPEIEAWKEEAAD